MIVKLRLLPEYGCYPVWLYDEHDWIVDTRLPDDLKNDSDLEARCSEIQERYEALFINNEREFSYVGFRSPEEREQFLRDWHALVEEIKQKAGDRYEIVDDIGDSF